MKLSKQSNQKYLHKIKKSEHIPKPKANKIAPDGASKDTLSLPFDRLIKIMACNNDNKLNFLKIAYIKKGFVPDYNDTNYRKDIKRNTFQQYINHSCNNKHCLKDKSFKAISYINDRMFRNPESSYFLTITTPFTSQEITDNPEAYKEFRVKIKTFFGVLQIPFVGALEFGSSGNKLHFHCMAWSVIKQHQITSLAKIYFNTVVHGGRITNKDNGVNKKNYLTKILPDYMAKGIDDKSNISNMQYFDLSFHDFTVIKNMQSIKSLTHEEFSDVIVNYKENLKFIFQDVQKNMSVEYEDDKFHYYRIKKGKKKEKINKQIYTGTTAFIKSSLANYDFYVDKNHFLRKNLKIKDKFLNSEFKPNQSNYAKYINSQVENFNNLIKKTYTTYNNIKHQSIFFNQELVKYEIKDNYVRCYFTFLINDNLKKRLLSNVSVEEIKTEFKLSGTKENLDFKHIEFNKNFKSFNGKTTQEAKKMFDKNTTNFESISNIKIYFNKYSKSSLKQKEKEFYATFVKNLISIVDNKDSVFKEKNLYYGNKFKQVYRIIINNFIKNKVSNRRYKNKIPFTFIKDIHDFEIAYFKRTSYEKKQLLKLLTS